MKGLHKVIVQNNRLHYEFEIKRNITIIQGNSATGKTTLINMLRQLMLSVMLMNPEFLTQDRLSNIHRPGQDPSCPPIRTREI